MKIKGILNTSGSIKLSALGALVLTLLLLPNAQAQCGLPTKLVKPSSWQPQMGGQHVIRAALARLDDRDEDRPSIVGMWHVIFTAQSANGEAIPDTKIDNALVTWHSDKTEIMSSARPPQDGQICMGVWEKTGERKYFLNHIPWLANDTTNAPSGIGNPTGPVRLTESVTLSEGGHHYSGTFTLTAYGLNGNQLVTFTGVLAATRVTTSTTVGDLL